MIFLMIVVLYYIMPLDFSPRIINFSVIGHFGKITASRVLYVFFPGVLF